jgi:uncharacterized protein YlxP (DUF503 family)
MFVVAARCELHLPAAGSLKGKRSVLNRLKDRLKNATAAAVAEVEHQELWQRAALGLAVVSGEAQHAEELLTAARRVIESDPNVVLLEWRVERF